MVAAGGLVLEDGAVHRLLYRKALTQGGTDHHPCELLRLALLAAKLPKAHTKPQGPGPR